MMHEQECGHDEAVNHQLPVAAAFWIIQIVSAEECSNLMQNLMQIPCSTLSVILNVMATQSTWSLNRVYWPHWLVQWSHRCSCTCIPVHSPWLPGCIDDVQTVLVVLIARLFLDRPHYVLPQNDCHSKDSYHFHPLMIFVYVHMCPYRRHCRELPCPFWRIEDTVKWALTGR